MTDTLPPVTKIPLPVGGDFSEDNKFFGISPSMDKVLSMLHTQGWSLGRLYEKPDAVLPLPTGKFPAGRVYLIAGDMAVVVAESTGQVITSIPTAAALRTLNNHSPEVLMANPWASARWEEIRFAEEGGDADDGPPRPRWYTQRFIDRKMNAWAVTRVRGGDGARIYFNGEVLHEVADGDAAEDLGLPEPVCVLVDYLLEDTTD